MNTEFIDTNVLLYAEESDAGEKQVAAAGLINRLVQERCGALSTQVRAEFYSVGTTRFRMSSEEAEQVIRRLASWTLHRPDHASVLSAAHLHRRYKIAWWDALIVNSAVELGCSVLWTEDLRHGQRIGSLTVRNPFR